MYQQGSVESIWAAAIPTALSLWANAGANPPANYTAARPWYFILTWSNEFTFTPAYPVVLNDLTTDISGSASLIKQLALQAARDAYSGVPVTVPEGSQGGDARTEVLNEDTLEAPPGCGSTDYGTRPWYHKVGYIRNMGEAQDALQVVINNAQDESAVLTQRLDLIQAIGRGIGHIAAHEVAHQFLGLCCAMDANPGTDPSARGTINATGCNGRTDPSPWTGYWPAPKILLHWEQPTLDALGRCLGKGWRNSTAQSCHN